MVLEALFRPEIVPLPLGGQSVASVSGRTCSKCSSKSSRTWWSEVFFKSGESVLQSLDERGQRILQTLVEGGLKYFSSLVKVSFSVW